MRLAPEFIRGNRTPNFLTVLDESCFPQRSDGATVLEVLSSDPIDLEQKSDQSRVVQHVYFQQATHPLLRTVETTIHCVSQRTVGMPAETQ